MTSPDAASSIAELAAYRLQRATFYATKHGHLAFARKFGITGVEWRLMGTISLFAPIAMLPLSEEADVQLAQAHRTITSLAERGLVRCEGDVKDKRKVMLSLTPAGKSLYRKAFNEANQRNRRLLSSLTDKECLALFAMLDKIAAEGRVMLEEERKASA
ncbi:winged helix DNA-binding protein [Ramlibacter sp. G-1-2-2]|uniref:Winged helix DNA-binding protein n=1 Tax=Ramlibacter agri TaxID=2728837 RepID=A0A848HC86_9BURK|nr:winged helix DNA-binding protein [Ramlibacter agri]NML47080.1 winged helix DNA-binding protein [Ramlibacter agri]